MNVSIFGLGYVSLGCLAKNDHRIMVLIYE